jgi:hypothetical protein
MYNLIDILQLSPSLFILMDTDMNNNKKKKPNQVRDGILYLNEAVYSIL